MAHFCDDCTSREEVNGIDYCLHDYRPCPANRVCRNGWHLSAAWRDRMRAIARGEA